MAAMELRVVPAGVDEHVHRGVQNFVRLRRGSKIHAAVNNYTWTADPDDGTTPCVPYHIVEGLYARLIEAARQTSPQQTSSSDTRAWESKFFSRRRPLFRLSLILRAVALMSLFVVWKLRQRGRGALQWSLSPDTSFPWSLS